MAGANSSRPKRRNTRLGGNRPRTHPTPKARRKPVPPKPSKFHTAADVRRDAVGFRATGSAEQFRVSPTQAVREMRDGVPATALRQIQDRLELIRATAIVVGHALKEQNCELDTDAARVLMRHVSDALTAEMIEIGLLIHGGA